MPEPPFLPAYYHNRTSFFWYIRKFINECPSGLMTLHEFQRHFCDGTVGQESAEYAKQIFRTLDSNRVRKWLPLTLGPVNVVKGVKVEQWPVSLKEVIFPQDGLVDFREFVLAITMLIKGSAVEKLRWSFKLYDKDQDGAITRQEMLEIMQVCVSVLLYK